MRLINCGCGNKYVVGDNWINIDFNSRTNDVKAINILKGLPFEDGSVDVVFSSCMLEHFTIEQASDYLAECYRILMRGGGNSNSSTGFGECM